MALAALVVSLVLVAGGLWLVRYSIASFMIGAALAERGAEIVLMPGAYGKVDLLALLADLARRGVNELHIEAGHKLSGSFLREDLVDEFLVYQAPKLLGSGYPLAAFGPIERLDDALALRYLSIDRFGDDLRMILRPAGRENF